MRSILPSLDELLRSLHVVPFIKVDRPKNGVSNKLRAKPKNECSKNKAMKMFILDQSLHAMTSISISAPAGNAATATAERAGLWSLK